MSLFFVLISIMLTYFSPLELSPELGRYHLQQFILFPAFLGTVLLASHHLRIQWPQHLLMIGFWFAVVMSRLSALWFGGALGAFLTFGVVVCVYFLVSLNTFTPARIRVVCGVYCLCAVIMAIQGILAFHTGYQAEKLVQGGRVAGWGIVGNSNDFAQFLVVAIALLGAFWAGGLVRKILLLVLAAVLLYAVYLTFSRGAIFGLVAIFLVMMSTTRIPKILSFGVAGGLVLSLIAIGFGGGRDFSMNERSAASRVIAWGSGISDLRAHPFFGVGFSQFTDFNDLTAHNSFVLCFAELGLFGYFFWLALILTTVICLERMHRTPANALPYPEMAGLVRSLRAGLYAFLATAWFLSRTYNETLYLLLAMCGSVIHMTAMLPAQPGAAPLAELVSNRNTRMSWVRLTLVFEVLSLIAVYISVRLRTL
jgi:putative inorganic carbon (HCO3(-)) transporter